MMRNERWSLWLMTACLLLILAPMAMAQSQYISGTVVDPSGAVIAGAQVKVEDQAKKVVVRESTTDSSGRFQALNLQPGAYLITVEMAGFKKSQNQVNLDVNTKVDIGQIKLEVGEVTAEVSVTASTPLVQTTTMEKSYLVESQQIQQLPMNGRNWVALMSTVPGMVSSDQDDFAMAFNDVSGFHAVGGRGSQNNFYLDGSPNLDVGDNQSQYTQPSIDSIAEFKVQQSSFNAEYGRNSGMVVAVQSKSGGSSFHGTAYEYVRNDALDARYPTSINKDILHYNLFGGNFSGWVPIPKVSTKDNKKVFFFYNREMTRKNLMPAGQNFVDIPGPATLLNGDFSPFITSNKMAYAPQFNVGTVFQPGTLKFDSAGNIIDGVPYPNNIVPPSQWKSSTASLMKLFTGIQNYQTLPAAPAPGLVRWIFSSPYKLVKNQDLLRVDYNITNKTSTFFRWVNDDQTEYQSGAIWGWNSYGPQLPFAKQQRPKPGSSWSWNIINTFSPTLASETILSYNHQSQSLTPSDQNGIRTSLGVNFTQLYPMTNVANYLPDFQAPGGNGIPGITLAWGDPGWHNDGKDYAFTENLSWVKSAHTLKFGFYYNRDNKKQTATWGQEGEIDFFGGATNPGDTGSGLANLLLGNLSHYGMSQASVYPYFRFLSWEGYAQDSWKVNRKLTLEYGLRFQRTTPTFTYTRSGTPGGEGTFTLYSVDLGKWSAANAPQINLTNGNVMGDILQGYLANGLICDPCAGVDRGFAKTKNFVSPRIGFAYDMFGDGKMAIRGGFGQYTERLRQNNFNFGAGGQFPNGGGFSVNNINVDAITAGPPPTTVYPDSTYRPQGYSIFPVGNTMPQIYSWNLGIQRDMGHSFALDLSYVGNHGTHLMVQRYVNGSAPGFLLTPGLLPSVNYYNDALRPYLGYGLITSIETSGSSSYNAMLVRLSRRFTNRFSFNVNYTWSKTMDIVDNDSDNLVNPLNIRANWAPAGYDATHTLTVDYIYQLPNVKGALDNMVGRALLNGWQLSGITHYQSGFPLSVQSNGDLKGIDAGTQYVNLVGDPYAGLSNGRFLNGQAFQRPPDGQYGSLGRNALRGPGYGNWDFSMAKNIKIRESMNMKIDCDVFNLFNHPEIWSIQNGWGADNPGGGINSSTAGTFGTITSYRPARVLQFGFKFTF
jgi:hypothetical protein